MKLFILFSFLIFCKPAISQTIQKSSIDSLVKHAKNKKAKRLITRAFDSTIRENIIGDWQTINSKMQFKENNSLKIEYKDSATFHREWIVKDGVIIVEEKQEPGSDINFTIKKYYYVISSSPYKIEWRYPLHKIISSATKISN